MNSPELNLFKIIEDKDNWEKYGRYVKKHVLSEEGRTMFTDISTWHEDHTEAILDWDSFHSWFRVTRHAMFKPDKHEMYDNIIANVRKLDIESIDIQAILATFAKRDYFGQIADLAMAGAEGEREITKGDLQELLDKYAQDCELLVDDDREASFDILAMAKDLEYGDGLVWRLPELNISLGAPRGLIIVCARKDAGKSTWLASESSFFARQMKGTSKKLLWFTNEEGKGEVSARFVQSLLNIEADTIKKRPTEVLTAFDKVVDKSSLVFKEKMYHISDILATIKDHEPGAIIIDQLWNCAGYEKRAANETARQGFLFGKMRQVAQENECPVIVAHQLGKLAENVAYPDMSTLYNSGTAIQAPADAIITIGVLNDPSEVNKRYLGILASKLGRGPHVNKVYRHGQFSLTIVPERARFKGEVVL